MRVVWLSLLLGACTSPEAKQGPSSETTLPTEVVETGVATTEEPADVVAALIAGDLPPEEAFPALAWSGGLPFFDGERTWFLHWYEGGDWSVAGDFNDWEPTAMEAGAGFWYQSVEGELPAGTGYKFVNGGTEWVADPWARSFVYDGYGELSYAVPPADTYRLDRWPGLEGQGLVPRDVVVYVPPGEGPFDVLYAHDGQNLFNPESIWGGWRLTDAMAAAPDVLVVGVANTPDRMSEYVHVDDYVLESEFLASGDDYAALVQEDLRPHIEATYGSTGHDGQLGSSLGGLISLHIAWLYPGEYDFVASMSGTLGWGRFAYGNETMEERWLASPPPDVVVYVDSGGSAGPDGLCQDLDGDGFPVDDPDSSDNYCESRQFVDALAGSGFVWDETLFHWHEPDAPHQENAWADRVHLPLERFVGAR